MASPEKSILSTASSERTVLIVDDDPSVRQMLRQILSRHGYDCEVVGSATAALDAFPRLLPAVVVSDINMPGHDGLWLLRQIVSRFYNTAVIMLTGFAEVDTAVQCLRDGASDFLTKPIRNAHLVTAVERALDRRRLVMENRVYQETLETRVREATDELRVAYQEIADTYEDTLRSLCSALDAREEETGDHSRRVTSLALELAGRIGLRLSEREHLGRAALLHDIGKIGVPDHILLKQGALNDEEWATMRRHPTIGYRILEGIPFLRPAAEIVLTHHERFDGQGYPRGLTGEAIPIGARIFAVADAVDAITSDRPYRKAASLSVAFEEVRRCSGSHFDPDVVDALVRIGIAGVEAFRIAPSDDSDRRIGPRQMVYAPTPSGHSRRD